MSAVTFVTFSYGTGRAAEPMRSDVQLMPSHHRAAPGARVLMGIEESVAALLGQRLGEMHQVLGATTANKDFKPEVTGVKDTQAWAKDVGAQITRALQLLELHQTQLNPADQALVSELLAQKKAIATHVNSLAKATLGGLRIRVHGDLHLGQVLDGSLVDLGWLQEMFCVGPAQLLAPNAKSSLGCAGP